MVSVSFEKTLWNLGTVDFSVAVQTEWDMASWTGMSIHLAGSTPASLRAAFIIIILSPAVNGLSRSWLRWALPTTM